MSMHHLGELWISVSSSFPRKRGEGIPTPCMDPPRFAGMT